MLLPIAMLKELLYIFKQFLVSTQCLSNVNIKKFYLLFKTIIWAIAISSMASLTLRDIVELSEQYAQSVPVTRVEVMDASVKGIKLPNATICVIFRNLEYTDYSTKIREIFEKSKLINLSRLENNENEHWKISALFTLDYNSLKADWWEIQQNQSSFNSFLETNNVYESFTSDQAYSLYKKYANYLCNLFRIKMTLITESSEEQPESIDLCENVNIERIPFSIYQNELICFRVPLDLLRITNTHRNATILSSTDYYSYTPIIDGLDRMNMYPIRKHIQFNFRPLSILNQFNFTPYLMQTMIFSPEYPEIPNVLVDYEADRLLMSESKFWHSLTYKNEINYLTHTTVRVDIQIDAKYQRLRDKLDCTDVFDETNCVVTCREKQFYQICKCFRLAFRQFSKNFNNNYPICTPEHYYNCSKSYYSFLTSKEMKMSKIGELKQCFAECTKCSKLKFRYEVKSVHTFDWSNSFCDIHFNDYFFDNNVSCPPSKITINKYANGMNDYIDQMKSADLAEYFRERLQGDVTYVFKMKSFTYPLFNETLLITKGGFISQIGGTLGFYLGLSGLSCFALLVNFVTYLKRRWQRSKQVSLATSAVLHFWYNIGKQQDQNDLEKQQENNNENSNDLIITKC